MAAGKITGKDVKNSSLTGKDLQDSSLSGADVADGSLTGADVADGSLTGADVEDWSLGETDVAPGSLTGASVKDGSIGSSDLAPGVAGLRGLQRVSIERSVTATNDYYGSTFVTVTCPAGKVAISGGYELATSATDVAVFRNRPLADLTGWEVAVRIASGGPVVGTLYAVCATA